MAIALDWMEIVDGDELCDCCVCSCELVVVLEIEL